MNHQRQTAEMRKPGLTAADVMVTGVITVTPETGVHDAARIMLEHRISGLPVVNATGELVGIISEGDLMRRVEIGTEKRRSWWLEMMTASHVQAHDFVRSHATKVADVMTTGVVAVARDTPLAEIATLLEQHSIKRVPVVQEGRLVGLVSRANLLQAFAAASAQVRRPSAPEAVQSDQALREEVILRMKQVPGGMPWLVTVTVVDGVVDLRGAVTSLDQKAALRVAAEATPGVKAVNDHLFKMQRTAE
jgi:CBS-domain-containing membrane protein